MTIYLTFNDPPSGIYSSQVIDVVRFMREELRQKVRLIAFISIRGFKKNRRRIKLELRDAVVLPMFPGLHNWTWNRFTLAAVCLFIKPTIVIARSVLATQLAFKAGLRYVVYDGRGAIAEEWHEYLVVQAPNLLNKIKELEQESVLNSNFQMAVSEKLVKHWSESFGYNRGNYVVIPCTLNRVFEKAPFNQNAIESARQRLGIGSDEIVLAYSGSTAGWQSTRELSEWLHSQFLLQRNIKLLFLGNADQYINELKMNHPSRVIINYVPVKEVPDHLIAGDYGLLLRESSITNNVASPVKFAEYLACGLKVIISDGIGDYTKFVRTYNCGTVGLKVLNLEKIPWDEKVRIHSLAMHNFTKDSMKSKYARIFEDNLSTVNL